MDGGTVLVTGASGFVGKWTVIALLRAGFSVRGSVRSESKADAVRRAAFAAFGAEVEQRLDFVRLDLLHDRGWREAMKDVDAVMHIAAHIVAEEPRDMNVVVAPAVEGTERVLRFAAASGVKRVIVTSSVATIGYGHGLVRGRQVYSEADFTDLGAMRYVWAYCVGKTLAEQSAWAYARSEGLALTTIHPGAILGPALDEDTSVSLSLVGDLLRGRMPALPDIGFPVVDVRDVADMHLAALSTDSAAGQRYLATSDYMKFAEVAAVLRAAYPEAPVTAKMVPDWLIRILARFGGPTRQIINDIGNEKHYDRSKGEALLGRPLRSGKEAVLASAETLTALGLL